LNLESVHALPAAPIAGNRAADGKVQPFSTNGPSQGHLNLQEIARNWLIFRRPPDVNGGERRL
jgi:hypothetical protein